MFLVVPFVGSGRNVLGRLSLGIPLSKGSTHHGIDMNCGLPDAACEKFFKREALAACV